MAKQSKIFVLDTNVMLHDHHCLSHFQEHDIVIPIVVLEELDEFKKGHDQLNYNSRAFVRELEHLTKKGLFKNGISMGKGRGKLFVETSDKAHLEVMHNTFVNDIPDHRILAATQSVVDKNKGRYVALITKDVNLRMKAKALGLNAEDYKTDKVFNEETLGRRVVELNSVSQTQIDTFYDKGSIAPKDLKVKAEANQAFILRSGTGTALGVYDAGQDLIKRVDKVRCSGIEARNSEQTFALNALMDPNIKLVALTGIAGTGKTLLALAAALAQDQNYDQILLARPVIPLQNQEIGFLPGDIDAKIEPYMLPLYDNLSFIKNRAKGSRDAAKVEELQKSGKLQITPLAYIRGRSISDAYFIIDEAQNLTPHEVKTIITRAGENTKIVLTGDVQQIDSPYLDMRSNGVSYLADKMYGQSMFAHINLVKGERSELAELAGKLL